MQLKCPNCGAPLIVPFMCEYCGSRFAMDYDRIEIPIKMDCDWEYLAKLVNPTYFVKVEKAEIQ